MIKTTMLIYYAPYRDYKFFVQYTAENGNSVYTVDNRLVTKEEGNQKFIDIIKNAKKHEIKKSVLEAGNKEILDDLNKSIDPYTQYIDNYHQQKEAEEHNQRIEDIIKAFQSVAN